VNFIETFFRESTKTPLFHLLESFHHLTQWF